MVKENRDSWNGISVLLKKKSKQREKLHPNKIYPDKFYTYDQMYNEEIITDMTERNSCIFVHCNPGTTSTNKEVHFGSIKCCLNKERISNIYSIPNLEEMGFLITYDSMYGLYIFHTKDEEVQFNKNEMGLPYICTKTNRTWPLYRQSERILKASPRKKSPRLNFLVKHRG